MIQPNELKLGNWVKDRGGKFIRIDFFEHLQVGFGCKFGMKNHVEGWGDLHDLTEYTDYAEPIELTPEILEKAGFVVYDKGDNDYTVYGNQHDDSDFFLEFNWLRRDKGYTPMIKSIEHEIIGMPIKHLHQLQNLFYALTGQELEYNHVINK